MTALGNKEILSKNLKYYIERSGKDRRELSEIWGFPYSTVTEWINGRKYPRIDRIEIMADYFGILKSDLIEEKMTSEDKKNSDAIVDITKALFKDDKLCAVVSFLCSAGLDESKLANVKDFIEFQMKR
jgi:transcriptional regulator with XRE-family HTH domain